MENNVFSDEKIFTNVLNKIFFKIEKRCFYNTKNVLFQLYNVLTASKELYISLSYFFRRYPREAAVITKNLK